MRRSDQAGKVATKVKKKADAGEKASTSKKSSVSEGNAGTITAPAERKPRSQSKSRVALRSIRVPSDDQPITVRHQSEVPEGLPRKYFLKSTFNTHDIMHAPVEKTLKMLDKILAGERLFTM